MRLKKVAGGNFHIFESDFGKSISQAFYFATNLYSEVDEQPQLAGDVAVFPNPMRDALTLLPAGISGQAQWQVFNVQGQLIDQGNWVAQPNQRKELNASSWPSGTLVVVVRQEDAKWTRWVVKD